MVDNTQSKPHPCLGCGACCTYFRVSFYWGEAVPVELTEKISPFLSCMKGTNATENPRCIALEGEVGKAVACSIYESRSSSCRNFQASYENGVENERCAHARTQKGLPPLTIQDWKPFS